MPHTHPVVDNDPHFVINPITREITNESKKIKLMQGDHASEVFTFEVPRYIDGHDMSLCNKIAVHYINVGRSVSSPDVHIVTDAATDDSEEKVTFTWIIRNTATKYPGTLSFLIKFSCMDNDGAITYQWNTDIFKGITVSAGMDNGETICEEYPDILEHWKNDVLSNVAVLFNTSQALTEGQKAQARSNISAVSSDEFNQVKENKVDKDEIFNAGIRSISYVPLFGGSFTVTTVEEEGYIKPHAIATVTGRISKHYTYRVTINEEEYVLPCCLFNVRYNNKPMTVECLGNIGLYTSDVSGFAQDAIHDVPFCIISNIDENDFIHVFTQSPCEVSITVERMQKEQTPLPKSLIWGDDYCPIELKKYENSVFNGISIGSNILKNSRGTFAIGYGNEVSDQFGIAIGTINTVSGKYSYAEGYLNTSSGMFSHSEGISTIASGTISHSEGKGTIASGDMSHAEGFNATSSGMVSHAEGFNATSSGDMSHAEGFNTTSSGRQSHAEGASSNAVGPCSHAEGQATKANGAISHSGGNNSITDGRASFAHGNFSKATQPAQFAVGYGNDPQEDSIFEVGNGLNADGVPNNAGNTEPVTRQNAFRVTQSGVAIAQTGLQIGNTVISEDQLKKILALI